MCLVKNRPTSDTDFASRRRVSHSGKRLRTGRTLSVLGVAALVISALAPRVIRAQRAFTDHFTFYYTDKFENNPTPVESPSDLPPISVVVTGISAGGGAPPPIPDYVIKLAHWLEWAYACYTIDGFRLPAQTNIKIGKPVAPAITPNPDWIHFHKDKILSGLIPGTAAHELFHIVQLQYWKVYNTTRPMFVEGQAVAMENTVVPEKGRYQDFCVHANHRDMDGQGASWNHDFFDIGVQDWEDAYCTGIIWLYLMEHNTDGTSTRYPGTDFLKRFLEATDVGNGAGPPSQQSLYDALDDLLNQQSTTLDAEMREFVCANMIRLHENLGGDHPHGFWWDDTFFMAADSLWTIHGVDRMALFGEKRVLDLENEGDPLALSDPYQGTYVHPQGIEDEIRDKYGAAYWQYEADARSLINNSGGLAYPGPGLPCKVEVEIVRLSGEPLELFSVTGFREAGSIFHETGAIRFNDDRIERAMACVTALGFSDYEYRHTVTAYEWTSSPSWGPTGGLDYEHTYRFGLASHEVLMRGLVNAYDYHRGDVLSIVAFTTDTALDVEPSEFPVPPPTFIYTPESYFQLNLRKFNEDGFYLNHDQTLIIPAQRNDLTNHYVQEAAGDAFYRIELRQDPASTRDTGVLLTVFPFDITANPLPDLVVRDYRFELDANGRITGSVAVLNQGTNSISNARIPIFIEAYAWNGRLSTIERILYSESRVSLQAGETTVLTVDHETGWDWHDEENARPGHNLLEVTVEIRVNSLEGATGQQVPPPEELTTNNNGPERVEVYCLYTPEDFPFSATELTDLANFFDEENERILLEWEEQPSLPSFPPEFRTGIIERAKELPIFQRHEPWLIFPPPPVPPTVFSALRTVVSWAERIGAGKRIPHTTRRLCKLTDLSDLSEPCGILRETHAESGLAAPGMFYRGPAAGLPVVRLGTINIFGQKRPGKGAAPLDLEYCPGTPILGIKILRSQGAHPAVIDLPQHFCAGEGPRLVEIRLCGFETCEATAVDADGAVLASETAEPGRQRLVLRSEEGGIRRVYVLGSGILIRGVLWNCSGETPQRGLFKRGDANGDSGIDIADAIAVLSTLFAGGALNCLDAADANDDGSLDIADPISLLSYLYAGGPPPAPPNDCGEDTTADDLNCAVYPPCEE